MAVDAEFARWAEVEPWWDAFSDANSSGFWSDMVSITNSDAFAENWSCVEKWWKTHTESNRDSLIELQAELEDAQTAWAESNSHFDLDPLTADWASSSETTGPLRTNQEENWSQWLAHLIRAGPPKFSRALFGEGFDRTPRSVEREVHLPAYDDFDRYADVIAFYDEQAVSIEVKKGDEHYKKTTDTASLLESQFREEWHHILLLPANRLDALRQSFQGQMSETNEGSMITSNRSTDIEVMRWSDVGKSIRKVLLSSIDTDAHWEASAYLFCTLIEQKLARFVPKPVIDRITASRDVVRTPSSILIVRRDIDEQIAYLRETTSTSCS